MLDSKPGLLIAPDSFKGTFSAQEVAASISVGVRGEGVTAIQLPLADGGEGTCAVLVAAIGGELRTTVVSGPFGESVQAQWAILSTGDAVVEAAQAAGLTLAPPNRRDPIAASSRGVGELIAAAAHAGVARVLVAAGGTATIDGGDAAITALNDAALFPEIVVLCDTTVPWQHAATTFGPQKGADERIVQALQRRLATLARRAPRDPSAVPMSGAAGGLAGGLWAWREASLRSGADFVLNAVGFQAYLNQSATVITGEGRLDTQSLQGKITGVVARRALRAGITCHAVVGQHCLSAELSDQGGFHSVVVATDAAGLVKAGRSIAHTLVAHPVSAPRAAADDRLANRRSQPRV
jgi:glycerate 2-kinase